MHLPESVLYTSFPLKSPDRIVTFAARSRSPSDVSVPAKPPYTATLFLNEKCFVRLSAS
ncbi:hypothetical protein M2447_002763, partial [Ereboglobus sp. PH5-10]|nr:hypothetical protein [Ereboglobus sp. PH5-10]